jgi:single-strand DNA-binding protein
VTAAGERHEDNEWFNVVAWGTVAEACRERVGHGKHVYVEGRLHTRGWEDGDGRMHYRTEVVAQDVMVLGV